MRTVDWPPCIVTAFDLIGTRSLAATGRGSDAMIQMHNVAEDKINRDLPLHSYGYIWNDSVLLLSYRTDQKDRQELLAELSAFKSSLEAGCGVSMYAISVMGLAFPQDMPPSPITDGELLQPSRAAILKTSGWAMANCFLIEKKLGRNRADWYIDSRITDGANLPAPFASKRIELLPKKERRMIHMFKGVSMGDPLILI